MIPPKEVLNGWICLVCQLPIIHREQIFVRVGSAAFEQLCQAGIAPHLLGGIRPSHPYPLRLAGNLIAQYYAHLIQEEELAT